jgi:hypothetical protein
MHGKNRRFPASCTSYNIGNKLKKLLRLLLGLVVLCVIAAAFVFKQSPSSTNLPSLKPHIAKERVVYYDPAEIYKSTGASSVPPGYSLEPVMMRLIKAEKVDFDQMNKLIHRDLTPEKGWRFQPWPPPGIPRTATSSLFTQMIIATKGTSGSAGGSALTGMLGIPSADHTITVIPDLDQTTFANKKPVPASTFIVMEQRRLASWEVTWLKVKGLGKSPFASKKEMMDFEDF